MGGQWGGRAIGAHAAATTAFVEAMAGMMFLITPCVCISVTPEMLNCFARTFACS